MWCGSLRPVSAAPLGCQIAKGKVIYTADTVAVAMAVGGKHPGVCRRSSLCHPGSRTSFMDGGNSAVKPLSAAGAALRKMPFLSFTVCHLCRAATYQLAFFSFSVQTKCVKFPVSLPTDVPAVRRSDAHT